VTRQNRIAFFDDIEQNKKFKINPKFSQQKTEPRTENFSSLQKIWSPGERAKEYGTVRVRYGSSILRYNIVGNISVV
jgi:hypothetical protein